MRTLLLILVSLAATYLLVQATVAAVEEAGGLNITLGVTP
jgi:hypothetical protein